MRAWHYMIYSENYSLIYTGPVPGGKKFKCLCQHKEYSHQYCNRDVSGQMVAILVTNTA